MNKNQNSKSYSFKKIFLILIGFIGPVIIILIGIEQYEIAAGLLCFLLLPILIKTPNILLFLSALLWAIYWIPGTTSGFLLQFKDFILIGYILITIIKEIAIGNSLNILRKIKKSTTLLLIFIFLAVMGLINTNDFIESVNIWIRFVMAFLLYISFAITLQRYPKIDKKINNLLIISVLLSVIYVLIIKIGLISPLPPPNNYRVANPATLGFSYRESSLSWSIAIIIPFLFSHFIRRISKNSLFGLLWLFSVVSSIYVSILTKNRGGLVGALLVIIFMSFGYWKIKKNRIFIFNFFLIIMVVLILFINFQYLSGYFFRDSILKLPNFTNMFFYCTQ